MNKFNGELHITPEFEQACLLFNVQPDKFLQEFINKIDLPQYFTYPMGSYRDAHTMLLDYAIQANRDLTTIQCFQRHIRRMAIIVGLNKDVSRQIADVIDEWHWTMKKEKM